MNKYIKLSDFLKYEIKPFLCGVFLSRIMEEEVDGKHFFYAYTAFRASKAVFENDFPLQEYVPKLIKTMNIFSGYNNWFIQKATNSVVNIRFYILDDLNITKKLFIVLYIRR